MWIPWIGEQILWSIFCRWVNWVSKTERLAHSKNESVTKPGLESTFVYLCDGFTKSKFLAGAEKT